MDIAHIVETFTDTSHPSLTVRPGRTRSHQLACLALVYNTDVDVAKAFPLQAGATEKIMLVRQQRQKAR